LSRKRHRVEDLVYVGHDVLAVDHQLRVAWQPQRGVQYGASSLVLMCSPANMAAIRSRSPMRSPASRAGQRLVGDQFLL